MGTSSSTPRRSTGAWQRPGQPQHTAPSRVPSAYDGTRAAPSPPRAPPRRARRSAPAVLEHPASFDGSADDADDLTAAAAANPLARSAMTLPSTALADAVPRRGARVVPSWALRHEAATRTRTRLAAPLPPPAASRGTADAGAGGAAGAPIPAASPLHLLRRPSQASTEEPGSARSQRRASTSLASPDSPAASPFPAAMTTFTPVLQRTAATADAAAAAAGEAGARRAATPAKSTAPFEEPGLLSATSFTGATMSITTTNGDAVASTPMSDGAAAGAAAGSATVVVVVTGYNGQSTGEGSVVMPNSAVAAAGAVRVSCPTTTTGSAPAPASTRRLSVVSFRDAAEHAGDFTHTVMADVSTSRAGRGAPPGCRQHEKTAAAVVVGALPVASRGLRRSSADAADANARSGGAAWRHTAGPESVSAPRDRVYASATRPPGQPAIVDWNRKSADLDETESSASQQPSPVSPPLSYQGSDVSSARCGSKDSAAYALLASQQMAEAAEELEGYTASMRVVLRSWECVSERYDELTEELSCVMGRAHPEYAQLFLTSSLSAQARVMLNMIGEALVVVARPSEMFNRLLEMGALHRRYNVGEEHFLALQSAFMSLLPKYLPAEMRDTHVAAWAPFWKTVTQLLVHGRTSARGDWHATQQQAAFFADSRRLISAVAAGSNASAERGTFMTEMLQRAVAADPSMERFSQLRDRRTSVRAFNGIVRLLAGSEDAEATQLLMDELSVRHTVYGLDVAAMRGFRQPFIDTCKQALRRANQGHLWMATSPRSLGTFWDHVAASWARALGHADKSRKSHAERAPDGSEPFCLMFTDIEASTRLWEHNASVMGEAVEAHHRIIRSAIADYGAYEVKTVGDSFVIAAKSVLIAVRIALAVQLELMRGPIAKGFEMVYNPQGGGAPDCWRRDSLRVRIGIHYCRDATAVYDSVHQRYDYYGPSVNCTARVESAASGGQILMTRDALEALQEMPQHMESPVVVLTGSEPPGELESAESSVGDTQDLLNGARPLAELIAVRDWGIHTFKGIDRLVQLYSVLPRTLDGRSFDKAVSSIGSSSVSSALSSVIVRAKASTMDPVNMSMNLSEFEQFMHR